jgi:hypothetical protein
MVGGGEGEGGRGKGRGRGRGGRGEGRKGRGRGGKEGRGGKGKWKGGNTLLTRIPGDTVVTTLLDLMEIHRQELIVIIAGYPNEMDQFLNSNPGLKYFLL